ncbi:secretion system protein C [Sphingobium sp. SCG-1]|uniref:type II secretion system protein N n=1 Tax=Sphingobium sp. SCG-1 TaxID=2072936 RepID=UPI000CD6C101|nr:type II secretion system protein N [Sphingobium sp. SCG-1]AUW58702.1 secretion system protein C [Sphingobium sp. SCG-1]
MSRAITDAIRARAALLARRLPRGGRSINPVSVLEWLVLALVAIQIARLIWAIATPVSSFGAWAGRQVVVPSAIERQALFTRFDPFFRTPEAATSGSPVVTSLALTVYGIRVNEGSGQGSAIVATPDGLQNSFAVGDEILPGVKLKAVAFDHIVIDRGGAEETVFLDQSQAAPVADPNASADPSSGSGQTVPQNVVPQSLTPAAIRSDIGFSPRTEGGRVTGLVLSPKGAMFQSAGFQPGDIVTQVNGRPITSMSDLQALQNQIAPGARISLMVERGASTVPIALTLQGS